MTSEKEIYIPPSGPPKTKLPSPEIYKGMGKTGIYEMIADFYRLLARSEIRSMFPDDETALIQASEKSAAFFVQICGGPPIYNEQHGAPRLRARHLQFDIGPHEKKVWLKCFMRILDTAPEKYGFPETHLDGFREWLTAFAGWMVNKMPATDIHTSDSPLG